MAEAKQLLEKSEKIGDAHIIISQLANVIRRAGQRSRRYD